MRQRTTIRKSIAFFLLLLFAISAAPKAYFHDLVANHKDVATCDQVHTTSVLHKLGYNCHCDDLVVSAPFMPQPVVTSVVFYVYSSQPFRTEASSFHQQFVQHKEGRGPPTA